MLRISFIFQICENILIYFAQCRGFYVITFLMNSTAHVAKHSLNIVHLQEKIRFRT